MSDDAKSASVAYVLLTLTAVFWAGNTIAGRSGVGASASAVPGQGAAARVMPRGRRADLASH